MTGKSTAQYLFVLTVILTLFGVLMVGNASVVTAAKTFGDKWYFLKLQGGLAIFGIVGCLVASKIPLKKLEKFATPFFLISIALLLLVLIPGIGTKVLGARRWLNFGPLSFQPSEIAKLATSIYLAKLFKTKPSFTHLCVVLGLLGFLIMAEPDMGTLLVLTGMSVGVYFGSGGKISRLAMALPIVAIIGVVVIILSPYRASRIKTYFDISHDPLGASYQIRQALIGLGSGGFTGVGLGESRQKFDFLPEATTDSIFAVIGEETGFIGSALLLFAFITLGALCLKVTQKTSDRFSQNLGVAISCWLLLQVFINISAILALLPFTGIPLTFISYGRTALLSSLFAMGIMINIAKSEKS